jgi:hypothetical protein
MSEVDEIKREREHIAREVSKLPPQERAAAMQQRDEPLRRKLAEQYAHANVDHARAREFAKQNEALFRREGKTKLPR